MVSMIMTRLGRAGVVVVTALLALSGIGVVWVTTSNAGPDRMSMAGADIPENQLGALIRGAESCPALTPARLAGQVMEQSEFDTSAARGVADLPDKTWKKWQPWKGADRSDPTASILALAHYTCDLVGRVRGQGLTGDLWLPAVAAFHSGVSKVAAAEGVPGVAESYADRVEGYAKWYALHVRFGALGGAGEGSGPEKSPSPSPSPEASKEAPEPSTAPEKPDAGKPGKPEVFTNPEFHGCLSATAARDGTPLSMAKCDGSGVQRWEIHADGTIRSVGLCMDAANASTENFTTVQMAYCSGNPAQQFRYEADKHKIYSPYAGKCVNVHYTKEKGTSIVIHSCLDQPNQTFYFKRP